MGDVIKLKKKVCPLCGNEYVGHPALSRLDNATYICPDCGQRQALESVGITDKLEQDKVINLSKGVRS